MYITNQNDHTNMASKVRGNPPTEHSIIASVCKHKLICIHKQIKQRWRRGGGGQTNYINSRCRVQMEMEAVNQYFPRMQCYELNHYMHIRGGRL